MGSLFGRPRRISPDFIGAVHEPSAAERSGEVLDPTAAYIAALDRVLTAAAQGLSREALVDMVLDARAGQMKLRPSVPVIPGRSS